MIFAIVVIATSGTLALGQQRGGQRGGGFMSRMTAGGMTPDYMLRDLRRFEEALALTQEQTMIVEQILRDYDESFREASETSQESMRDTFSSMRRNDDDPARQEQQEMRQRMRDIREKIDSAQRLEGEEGMQDLQDRLRGEMEQIRESMNEARTAQWQSPERQAAMEDISLFVTDQLRLKRQMKSEFEGDLVAILDEEQLLLWPPLQRMLIRDRLLPRGRISGETLDVMGLVEQQDFEDSILANLLPALNSWDVTVTSALEARDNFATENQGQMMAAMRTMDSSGTLSVMKEQARYSESVRDINDNAVEQIVLKLPSEEGSAFKQIARERAYPRIFRQGRVQRAYQAAMELVELEPETLQAIVELYDVMLIDMEYVNEQLLSATKRWESQEQIDRMNRFASRMSGMESEQTESPIRKAEDSRTKIENNYLEQLRLLLNEEQIESLGGLKAQKPREDRGDRGAWRNRDDRGGRSSGDREAFMKRFDKDGNGELSESEREEIRSYFRNGGGRDFGGGDQGGNARPGSGRERR